MVTFLRTDFDGSSELLSLVRIEGESFYSELLDRESPIVVQSELADDDDEPGDFGGLYDLDGEAIPLSNCEFEIADDADLTPEVVALFEAEWSNSALTAQWRRVR